MNLIILHTSGAALEKSSGEISEENFAKKKNKNDLLGRLAPLTSIQIGLPRQLCIVNLQKLVIIFFFRSLLENRILVFFFPLLSFRGVQQSSNDLFHRFLANNSRIFLYLYQSFLQKVIQNISHKICKKMYSTNLWSNLQRTWNNFGNNQWKFF